MIKAILFIIFIVAYLLMLLFGADKTDKKYLREEYDSIKS